MDYKKIRALSFKFLIFGICLTAQGCVTRTSGSLDQTYSATGMASLLQDMPGKTPELAPERLAPPERLIALSADKLPARTPAKAEIDAGSDSWFHDPSLHANFEECPHCKARGVIISSYFGNRKAPKSKKKGAFHSGIDVRGIKGSSVLALKGGKVSFAGRNAAYGLSVEITQYDGKVARYAHMSKLHVKEGDVVSSTDTIGEVGNTGRTTGYHLHFEILNNGKAIDPMPYVEKPEQLIRCLKLDEAPSTTAAVSK